MHFAKHVSPLLVRAFHAPMTYALLPVPLSARPSGDPELFSRFIKQCAPMVSLHEDDALRVRNYMKRHNTEALTSDGLVAFTLHGNQLLQCDPTACGQPGESLMVRFCPMEWIRGKAMPAGTPEAVDVTDVVLAMPATAIAALRDAEEGANALIDPATRGHYGPYIVKCEAAICSFLGVETISAVTQDVLDAKRAGQIPWSPYILPFDIDGGEVWMLGVGQEKIHFNCRADDIDDAISQCRQTFPGKPVTSACSIA